MIFHSNQANLKASMSLLQQLIDSITPEVKRYTRLKFDIADAIMTHLKNQGKTQKDFAETLEKSESGISKWLTGQHNLTVKSIARMEVALGIEIIKVQIPARLQTEDVQRFRKSSSASSIRHQIASVSIEKSSELTVQPAYQPKHEKVAA
jgi:transcriptional regulator with XRE-family HTH domain